MLFRPSSGKQNRKAVFWAPVRALGLASTSDSHSAALSMASKLNAFLAAVPANPRVPVAAEAAHSSLRATASLPALVLKEPAPGFSPQPATPQPQMNTRRRRHSSRPAPASVQGDALKISVIKTTLASNQEDADEETGVPTPLTPPPKPRALSRHKEEEDEEDDDDQEVRMRKESTDVNANESGALRRMSSHCTHHRRVSTDTAMFNRYLRLQAHRDIDHEVVQHFETVPIVTTAHRQEQVYPLEEDNNELHRNVIDPVEILAILRRGETLSVALAIDILAQATNLMNLDQNVITITAPYTLVGDLHGQFQDLLEIFEVHGLPSSTNPFLFLGDYVDRGISSCEILLLLLACKVAFPSSVHLLRGNHECRSLSTFYGFRAECLQKYGTLVYNRTIKCFESLPLAARLETSYGVFLAVHGGLSPEINYVTDINDQVHRFVEPEPNGALCDLLWSDPAKETAQQEEDWAHNNMRGCSYTFSESVCRDFLQRNNLLAIIRAHELEEDGFKEHFQHVRTSEDESEGDIAQLRHIPPVVTVFSAPEYCNTNHNMGATLKIPYELTSSRLLDYRQHARSKTAEHVFNDPSEDDAMKLFICEQLPFLPVNFYELVGLCRRLRATLSQPVLSAQSSLESVDENPKSSTYVLDISQTFNRNSISGDSVSNGVIPTIVEGTDETANADDSETTERQSIGHTVTEESSNNEPVIDASETKTLPSGIKEPTKGSSPATRRASGMTTPKKRREGRDRFGDSGMKLCPGVQRFLERYFGSPRKTAEKPTVNPVNFKPSLRRTSSMSSWIPVHGGQAEKPSSMTESSDDSNIGLKSVEPSNQITSDTPTAPPSTKNEFEQLHMIHSPKEVKMALTTSKFDIFTKSQWQALKLYFTLLDIAGTHVLMEESFVVLLTEQDSDAYATEEEVGLLMDVMDCDGDGLITEQDFLLFAYRSQLQWKKTLRTAP